jgi:hypothetical protein
MGEREEMGERDGEERENGRERRKRRERERGLVWVRGRGGTPASALLSTHCIHFL